MPKLIKNLSIVDDAFSIKQTPECPFPSSNVLVSLQEWKSHKNELSQQPQQVGVWLNSDEEPEELVDDIQSLQVIAINFPTFADGRGYSIARLLRERYGYTGELRAIGDVLRDQLFYMSRCGFDTFSVREDRDINDALEGLSDFSEVYQTSTEQPKPLFRRR